MYEIKFEFCVGLCGGFLFVSLFVPFFTSLPAYLFIYLFLPFFIFYLFLSLFFTSSLFLCVILFTFFLYFLSPSLSSFMLLGQTNYIDILFFTWSLMGNQNNIIKFGVPGFFGCSGVPGCSGVFRSVSECFGVPVFRCSWF